MSIHPSTALFSYYFINFFFERFFFFLTFAIFVALSVKFSVHKQCIPLGNGFILKKNRPKCCYGTPHQSVTDNKFLIFIIYFFERLLFF